MIRKIEFLLATIVVIFMVSYCITGIYIFIQISATVALVNFIVSTIRCAEQYSISKKGGEDDNQGAD